MRNKLYQKEQQMIRVLEVQDNRILCIDCKKFTMPGWMQIEKLQEYQEVEEAVLLKTLTINSINNLSSVEQEVIR